MKKVGKVLDRAEEICCVILFIAFVALAMLQIITRFTPATVKWTEELARYCFIWFSWMGLSWAIKDCDHLKIDVVVLMLSDKAQSVHRIICNGLMLVFNIAIFYYSFDVIAKQMRLGQEMVGLPIPLWVIYLIIPFSFGLSAVRSVQVIVRTLRHLAGGGEEPREMEKGGEV